jgi:hypothetical protein
MEFCGVIVCYMAQMIQDVRSRFFGVGKGYSIAAVLTLLLLIVICVWPKPITAPPAQIDTTSPHAVQEIIMNDDLRLYRLIHGRIEKGVSYYQAAFAEHRINGYPVKPFVTVRLPTLALVSTALGHNIMTILLASLGIAIVLAWWRQLDGAFRDPGRRVTGVMLLASGLMLAAFPKYIVLHELWAGMFIALSLGLYRQQRFWPSVLAAACALAIRETTLPFVMLMAAFAIFEGRWREVMAWGLLICAFAAGLYAHYVAVSALVTPSDLASPGWAEMGGMHAAVRALTMTSALRALPEFIAALAIPLALFGWTSWRGAIGLRGTLYLAGYSFMLMLIGRAENFYWGVMVAPLLLLGLAFLPQAIMDIVQSLKSRRPIS